MVVVAAGVVGVAHGVLVAAQTVPGMVGGGQLQLGTSAQPSSVLTHWPSAGTYHQVQAPPQPGGGGGWVVGGSKTHSVWAVAQNGSPAGASHGQASVQPLLVCCQAQPSAVGTPTQSQPSAQGAGVVPVVDVLQSQVVGVAVVVGEQ